jgi:hypothetical protein
LKVRYVSRPLITVGLSVFFLKKKTDALRQQAYRDAVQEHVISQLELSLESLAASSLRASFLESLSEDLRRRLEAKTVECQQHAQRATKAEEHARRLAEQCDAQVTHSQKSSK